jgi:CheY-like chemotaxis protein
MTNAQPGRRTRILVVDDEDFMRQLLKLHLENAGYEVALAADAVIAGHAILQSAPDLVLLDVHMPYMDGYDFAAALKADPNTAAIPVVFLSSDDKVADQAQKLGAVAYLRKPLTTDRLLAVVDLFAEPAT